MQSLQMLGQEVAYAQRPHALLLAQTHERLPGLPRAPVERRGPVDHVHVHILELQQADLAVERLQRAVIPLLGVAQLGRDPQLAATLPRGVAGVHQRTAHTALIVVAGRTVDVTVSSGERRFHHRGHALVVDAQHAKAHLRNLSAVMQADHRNRGRVLLAHRDSLSVQHVKRLYTAI